jgi:hypothetical protein
MRLNFHRAWQLDPNGVSTAFFVLHATNIFFTRVISTLQFWKIENFWKCDESLFDPCSAYTAPEEHFMYAAAALSTKN